MKRDQKLYVFEILTQIELIEKSFLGKSKEDLENNLDLKDATIRRIEIIGEAIKQISPEIKNKYPQVEWKSIVGTRDNIIHGYFNVNLEIIWEIIDRDIPILKKQMQEIKNDLEKA